MTSIMLTICILYFLPTAIALLRGRRNPGGVIVVNIFLGWTFIGWVVALAMSFGEITQAPGNSNSK